MRIYKLSKHLTNYTIILVTVSALQPDKIRQSFLCFLSLDYYYNIYGVVVVVVIFKFAQSDVVATATLLFYLSSCAVRHVRIYVNDHFTLIVEIEIQIFANRLNNSTKHRVNVSVCVCIVVSAIFGVSLVYIIPN